MSTIAITPQVTRSTAAPVVSGAVRLTRRGKAVVLTLALVALAVLVIALGSAGFAAGQSSDQPTRSVQVVAGHTLWQIAAEANPDGDIRSTVDEIVRLNSLPSASALQLGSTIAVPIY